MRAVSYGKYNMLADVYTMTSVVQPSGQRLQEWDYDNPTMTIECIVRAQSTDGSREEWGKHPEDIEWVRIKTKEVLDKNMRIGNIRTVNRWGETIVHWQDGDGVPEIFDVRGVAAMQDPFGALLEYEVLAKKPAD